MSLCLGSSRTRHKLLLGLPLREHVPASQQLLVAVYYNENVARCKTCPVAM